MIPRHLWLGTALVGLFIGAATPADAQYDPAGTQYNDGNPTGTTLKPPQPAASSPASAISSGAPANSSDRIISQPPAAWHSGADFAQQPTRDIHAGAAPIISDPPNARPRPAAPAPASFSPEPNVSTPALSPLPPQPATAPPASESYTPQRNYTVPPLRDVTTAPEQEIKPLPGAAAPLLKPIPAPPPAASPAPQIQSLPPQPEHMTPPPEAGTPVISPEAATSSPAAPVEPGQADKIQSPATTARPGLQINQAPVKPAQAEPPAPLTTAPQPPPDMPAVPTMEDLTLAFAGNSSDLSPETQTKLNTVVRQLNDMADGRLQVRGYATGEDSGASSARRISLSRVLSVRSYLMDKGIKPTRVDVRAMGTETDRNPLDRVDLVFER